MLLWSLGTGLLLLLPQLAISGRTKKEVYDTLKKFGPSLYRPPPPLVRRDAISRVKYDPEKWISEPHMTISGAIMFDRQTGLNVDECLNKCTRPDYQICDLFAIDGSSPPYFLTEFLHRDYFKYLAALPPSDVELRTNVSHEMSVEVQEEEKKFESTSTTTQSSLSRDLNLIATLAPSIVGTSELFETPQHKIEDYSDFNPFLVGDSTFKASSKEEGTKALASKQTGNLKVITEVDPSTRSNEIDSDKTVEYHHKPSLKLSIVPIRKSGEKTEETSSEQPTIIPEIHGSIASTEITTSSETPIKLEDSNIPTTTSNIQTTTIEGTETDQKASHIAQLEEKQQMITPVKIEFIEREPGVKSSKKKKIQGITTHIIQDINADSLRQNGCNSGEVSRFIQIKQYGRDVESTKELNVSKLEECVEACATEQSFLCKSSVFSSSSCSLFADSVNHGSAHSLIKDDNSTYLERVCILERLASKRKIVYEAIRNFILVGQVQEVTDAPTLIKCQTDCLTAAENLGFVCRSAMWYPTDIESGQNCLLNSEDHGSKSDALVPEDSDVNMIYFSVGEPEHRLRVLGDSFKLLDSPIKKDDSGWTRWSSNCKDDKPGAIRHRYLKCSYAKDVRKCPKQSAMCKPPPSLQIQKLVKPESECRAVRDSRGVKRCPHGVRYDSRGIRHYCVRPTDC